MEIGKKLLKSEKKRAKERQMRGKYVNGGNEFNVQLILMYNIYPLCNKFLDKIFIQEKSRGK